MHAYNTLNIGHIGWSKIKITIIEKQTHKNKIFMVK